MKCASLSLARSTTPPCIRQRPFGIAQARAAGAAENGDAMLVGLDRVFDPSITTLARSSFANSRALGEVRPTGERNRRKRSSCARAPLAPIASSHPREGFNDQNAFRRGCVGIHSGDCIRSTALPGTRHVLDLWKSDLWSWRYTIAVPQSAIYSARNIFDLRQPNLRSKRQYLFDLRKPRLTGRAAPRQPPMGIRPI